LDIDTVISFWVKWCLPSFVVVMLGLGYFGSGMVKGDAQLRVMTACQEVRTGAAGIVTITQGNTIQKYEC